MTLSRTHSLLRQASCQAPTTDNSLTITFCSEGCQWSQSCSNSLQSVLDRVKSTLALEPIEMALNQNLPLTIYVIKSK